MVYENQLETIVGEKGDTKPTEGIIKFTRFKEYDTGDTYYWDGSAWQVIGYNAEE